MFTFDNLDSETRRLMIEELEFDKGRHGTFISSRLLEEKEDVYLSLLQEALSVGTPESLATAITGNAILRSVELRTRNGKQFQADVPYTANFTLAEGEFNRYYVRALCLRSLNEGKEEVTVYRAKPVRAARSNSEMMIGKSVNCQKLLDDLRNNIGVDTALGIPAGPNSGLSVRLRNN